MVIMRMVSIGAVMSACATQATTSDVRKMGDRGDVEGLMKAWDETDRDAIRIEVIRGLAANGSGKPLILRQARSATSEQVRLTAIQSVRAFDGSDANDVLIGALADPFPAIREVAQSEIAKAGTSVHETLLSSLSQHPTHLVRAASAKLLSRAAKGPDAAFKVRVSNALMDAAQRDDAPKVREAAAVGLGALGIVKARTILTTLMKTDGDSGVRMAAERALGKLGAGDEEKVVVAVLPFANQTGQKGEIALLGAQIAEYLSAKLSSTRVCDVVDPEKTQTALKELEKVGVSLYEGDSLNTPQLGQFKLASQLVYGTVQKQGKVYTIVANRMDVATLQIVPGASVTVTGYRSDLQQMKAELTEQFIKRFR